MRILSTLLLSLLTTLALAQDGMLGTKGGGSTTFQPTAASGGSFLQMIFALLIVLGVMKFALPKLFSAKILSKFGGKLTTGLNSSIKIEESATFPGGALHLVTVRDRVLLLGSTATAINTLADLGQVQKNDPGPTFMEFLDHAAVAEEPKSEVAPVEAPKAVDENVQAALDRLHRLMR